MNEYFVAKLFFEILLIVLRWLNLSLIELLNGTSSHTLLIYIAKVGVARFSSEG